MKKFGGKKYTSLSLIVKEESWEVEGAIAESEEVTWWIRKEGTESC